MRKFFVQFKKGITAEEWDLFIQTFRCTDINVEEKNLIVEVGRWYTLARIDLNLNVAFYEEII